MVGTHSDDLARFRLFAEYQARFASAYLANLLGSATHGRLKQDGTIVTAVDEFLNGHLIRSVKNRFPDHDVYGEEESSRSGSRYVWIIDPLDGTLNFSRGIPTVGYSLALAHDGEIIVGVIALPGAGELYIADLETPTIRTGVSSGSRSSERVSVSGREDLDGALIGVRITPRSDLPVARILEGLVSHGAELTDHSSAAYMGAKVASGELDAFLFPGRGGHDMAAVDIIVRQAGGIVSRPDGEGQSYDGRILGALAAGSQLHDRIVSAIAPLVDAPAPKIGPRVL